MRKLSMLTLVAHERFAMLIIRKTYAAVWAFHHLAAVVAYAKFRIASLIEKQQYLRAIGKRLLHFSKQWPRQYAHFLPGSFALILRAKIYVVGALLKIDDHDGGQYIFAKALFEHEVAEFSSLHVN